MPVSSSRVPLQDTLDCEYSASKSDRTIKRVFAAGIAPDDLQNAATTHDGQDILTFPKSCFMMSVRFASGLYCSHYASVSRINHLEDPDETDASLAHGFRVATFNHLFSHDTRVASRLYPDYQGFGDVSDEEQWQSALPGNKVVKAVNVSTEGGLEKVVKKRVDPSKVRSKLQQH